MAMRISLCDSAVSVVDKQFSSLSSAYGSTVIYSILFASKTSACPVGMICFNAPTVVAIWDDMVLFCHINSLCGLACT